jgi:hypothetical protein
MRTTIELPPALLRKAKARAAQRGETLKAFLTRAVAAELGESRLPPSARARVVLPLVGDPGGPPVHLTSEALARALEQEIPQATAKRRRQAR